MDLRGGRTKDGSLMVGASVFYDAAHPGAAGALTTMTAPGAKPASSDLDSLDSELKDGEKATKTTFEAGLSSYVWICTSGHSESK